MVPPPDDTPESLDGHVTGGDLTPSHVQPERRGTALGLV
jgi:hypothetical protein